MFNVRSAITIGTGNRLMFTVSLASQPLAFVPVTIYSVFTVGVATGLLMAVLLKPAAGVHEYETAPEACNCTSSSLQIVVSVRVNTTGVSMEIITLSRCMYTGAKDISSSAKSLPLKTWFILSMEIVAVV